MLTLSDILNNKTHRWGYLASMINQRFRKLLGFSSLQRSGSKERKQNKGMHTNVFYYFDIERLQSKHLHHSTVSYSKQKVQASKCLLARTSAVGSNGFSRANIVHPNLQNNSANHYIINPLLQRYLTKRIQSITSQNN